MPPSSYSENRVAGQQIDIDRLYGQLELLNMNIAFRTASLLYNLLTQKTLLR